MIILEFKGNIGKWEQVDADEVFVVGRRYLSFTPKDGRKRLVLESNPCIKEIGNVTLYSNNGYCICSKWNCFNDSIPISISACLRV